MIFRPSYYSDTGCAADLFGCGSVGVCAVVDPRVRDLDAYVDIAFAKGMRLTQVIDTHVHAHRVSGGRALAERTDAKYALHESAEVSLHFEPRRYGQIIALGSAEIEVVHTPGHSHVSVCLHVTEHRRGPESWFVLTGDTLFVGSVGRPDLHAHAGDDAAHPYDSSHQRLKSLSDDIEVYPGHFAGSLCGAGMSGKLSSTIRFEKRWNTMLAKLCADFVAALADVPENPADMVAILNVNHSLTEQ